MRELQFIQITPEALQDAILDGVKTQLELLKKDFQPKDPTEYLTRQQVAKMLHIDLSTLHTWTKKVKLNSYGIVGRVYYKRNEIEQALIKIN